MKTLRTILWDHLSHDLPSLSDLDIKNDSILICGIVDDCYKKPLLYLLNYPTNPSSIKAPKTLPKSPVVLLSLPTP